MVQTTTIFANVSKGVLAKHEDVQAVFGTIDEEQVCRRILQDGDLQVREHIVCWPHEPFCDIVSAPISCSAVMQRRPVCIVHLHNGLLPLT